MEEDYTPWMTIGNRLLEDPIDFAKTNNMISLKKRLKMMEQRMDLLSELTVIHCCMQLQLSENH